jgi:hypothetical protein
MKIDKYKTRFFSLLESEMGNVKPLITESIEENQTSIEDILVDEYDFEKVAQAQKGGDFNIEVQYDKKFGKNKLSFLIIYNQEDAAVSPDSIVMIIFFGEEGKGSAKKITADIVGGTSNFVIIKSDNIKTEGKDIIEKAINFAQEGVEEDAEGTDMKEEVEKMMSSLGFKTNTTSTGFRFDKTINDGKRYSVFANFLEGLVSLIPVVIDDVAKDDPVLYGINLPVVVGVINIKKGMPIKSQPVTLTIEDERLKNDSSKIVSAIRDLQKFAEGYKGKAELEKELTNTERLR